MSLTQLTANYSDSDTELSPKQPASLSVSSEDNQSDAAKESSAKNTPVQVTILTSRKKVSRLVAYANDEDDEGLEEEGMGDEFAMVQEEEFEANITTEAMEIVSDNQDDQEKLSDRDFGIKLPPPPPNKCSAQLQDKITHFLHKVQHENMDYNGYIQNNKAFRNPSIYEKLISHLCLDEQGSNYPLELFDPHCWGKESYYDELAKVQSEEMDKREKERKERAKNESSSKKPVEEESKKRKSRFDQGVPMTGVVKNVPLPSLSTVTTKSINPFGVVKKK